MPGDTWLHTSRNAAIAISGAPRSSHSWRMCARGSSPRQIATMGLRKPRPTSDSARIAASMAAFTRGNRGFAGAGRRCGRRCAAAACAAARLHRLQRYLPTTLPLSIFCWPFRPSASFSM